MDSIACQLTTEAQPPFRTFTKDLGLDLGFMTSISRPCWPDMSNAG